MHQTEEHFLAGIHSLVLSIAQSLPQLLCKSLLGQAGLQGGLTRQVCRRQLRRGGQIKFSLSPISSFWPVFPGTPNTATVLCQANKQFSALPQQREKFSSVTKTYKMGLEGVGGKKKKVKGRKLVYIY